MKRTTTFSDDRLYRFTLWREFQRDMLQPARFQDSFVQFIGLNPSTADENQDDPTIRRCIGFAKAWGYGALCMTNLFAFRATDPNDMKARGPYAAHNENAHWLVDVGQHAGLTIAAWGMHGRFQDREKNIMPLLTNNGIKLHHLGRNADGTPRHPLYLAANTMPVAFQV